MKRAVFGSVVALACCVAGPFAKQQSATPDAAAAHKVFVLNGCLEADIAPKAIFKLTDASTVSQSRPAGVAEAGAIGTSGQKASYELQPVSGLNAQD